MNTELLLEILLYIMLGISSIWLYRQTVRVIRYFRYSAKVNRLIQQYVQSNEFDKEFEDILDDTYYWFYNKSIKGVMGISRVSIDKMKDTVIDDEHKVIMHLTCQKLKRNMGIEYMFTTTMGDGRIVKENF